MRALKELEDKARSGASKEAKGKPAGSVSILFGGPAWSEEEGEEEMAGEDSMGELALEGDERDELRKLLAKLRG